MRSDLKRLVVVGNGMAGVACVEQILKYAPQFDITIFGDETHVNYNRIMLSSVLAGERAADEITLNPLEWYARNGIDLRLGDNVGGGEGPDLADLLDISSKYQHVAVR